MSFAPSKTRTASLGGTSRGSLSKSGTAKRQSGSNPGLLMSTVQAGAMGAIHNDTAVVSSDLLSRLSLTNQKTLNSSPRQGKGSAPHNSVNNSGNEGISVIAASEFRAIQQTVASLGSRTLSASGSFHSSSSPSSSTAALRESEKARARKEKIVKMEQERLQRSQNTMSDEALADLQVKSSTVSRARLALDEEADDVKHMNQMMLYAKCASIREQQIAEKKRLSELAAEEEKRLDQQMELERIQALKLQAERERRRAEEQRAGASVISVQIMERQAERLRQQEATEHDAQMMLQRIKALEEAEEAERQERVEAGRKLLQQVLEANNAQARAKLRKKQEEAEEDKKIAEYIRQKDAREARAEEELERIRAEKEREVARLRAMQEKAQDRRSQIDELRAKRYQEAKDRQWRQQQMAEAAKREKVKQEIAYAREYQREEKHLKMAEQAQQEQEEIERILSWQRQQMEAEERKALEEQERRLQHKSQLMSQMSEKEQQRVKARAEFLTEGQILARRQALEAAKLEAIKQQKLAELEKEGVPAKYRAELAKKKVLQAQIHPSL